MAKQKYSNEDIAKALKTNNGYIYLAARSMNCNAKTIMRRVETVTWLKELLDDLRGIEIDIAEQKLKQAIFNGEPWAIALKLKTQGKDRGYVERSEVTGVKDGEPITFVFNVRDSNDEKDL